jgi:hypothetical protein
MMSAFPCAGDDVKPPVEGLDPNAILSCFLGCPKVEAVGSLSCVAFRMGVVHIRPGAADAFGKARAPILRAPAAHVGGLCTRGRRYSRRLPFFGPPTYWSSARARR